MCRSRTLSVEPESSFSRSADARKLGKCGAGRCRCVGVACSRSCGERLSAAQCRTATKRAAGRQLALPISSTTHQTSPPLCAYTSHSTPVGHRSSGSQTGIMCCHSQSETRPADRVRCECPLRLAEPSETRAVPEPIETQGNESRLTRLCLQWAESVQQVLRVP